MPNLTENQKKRKFVGNLGLAADSEKAIAVLRANWAKRIGQSLANLILVRLMLDFTAPGTLEDICVRLYSEKNLPRVCGCGGRVTCSLYIEERGIIIDLCDSCADAAIL